MWEKFQNEIQEQYHVNKKKFWHTLTRSKNKITARIRNIKGIENNIANKEMIRKYFEKCLRRLMM